MMSTQKMTFPHSLMHLDHCSNAQAGQERVSFFKVKICILIYQIFVLEANTTFVCLKASSPQSNKTGKCFPPWLCVSAEVFLKNIESLRDKSETFNQKGPEWFLLHLITTSSLSPDGSAVLDSTADRSGEAEDSLQLGSWTPLLLKSMEEYLKLPFHCWNSSPLSTPGSSEAGRNLAPAGWSSEKSVWGCKLRLSLPQLPQSQTGSRHVWKSGGNLGEDCNHTAKSHTVQAAAGLAPHFYSKKILLLPLSMRAKYRGESFSL